MESNVLAGAVAGFAATAPMSAAMGLMHQQLPAHERYPLPPSEITAQAERELGAEAGGDEHAALTAMAHFGYGAACGALYAPLARRLDLSPLAGGISFGLGVWGVSYLGILPALGVLPAATEHPARRTALMIAAHVVWGAALGLTYERLTADSRQRG